MQDRNALFAAILDEPDAREDHHAHLVDVDAALEMFRAFASYHRGFGYEYSEEQGWGYFRSDLSDALGRLQGFIDRLPEAPLDKQA